MNQKEFDNAMRACDEDRLEARLEAIVEQIIMLNNLTVVTSGPTGVKLPMDLREKLHDLENIAKECEEMYIQYINRSKTRLASGAEYYGSMRDRDATRVVGAAAMAGAEYLMQKMIEGKKDEE